MTRAARWFAFARSLTDGELRAIARVAGAAGLSAEARAVLVQAQDEREGAR